MSDPLLELDYRIKFPPKTDYGIGFVGTGGIVNFAHIPAYRKAGFNLVGCYDINRESAERTAREHGIPRVYESVEALLQDPKIEIVDIAVPPWHQRDVVSQVAAAGKHVLCQKPLSDKYEDAVEIVRTAEQAGIQLAVNHQYRWSSSILATKWLLDQGWAGDLIEAEYRASTLTPLDYWPWLATYPRYDILLDSIHYIDAFRFLFGDPLWVTSRHTRIPNQTIRGETITKSIWDYPSGFQVLITQTAHDWTPDRYAYLRVLGQTGWIRGDLRSALVYPNTERDSIAWLSRERYPDRRFEALLEGFWIPDAFSGPMAGLMEAIQTDGIPPTNGQESLATLRVVEACYRSMAENRSVQPTEITA